MMQVDRISLTVLEKDYKLVSSQVGVIVASMVLIAGGIASAWVLPRSLQYLVTWSVGAGSVLLFVMFALTYMIHFRSKRKQLVIDPTTQRMTLAGDQEEVLQGVQQARVAWKSIRQNSQSYNQPGWTYTMTFTLANGEKRHLMWDGGWGDITKIPEGYQQDHIEYLRSLLEAGGVPPTNIVLQKGHLRLVLWVLGIAFLVWFTYFA